MKTKNIARIKFIFLTCLKRKKKLAKIHPCPVFLFITWARYPIVYLMGEETVGKEIGEP